MTSRPSLIIASAEDFHRAREKYPSIPKRIRSKMKREVKRRSIEITVLNGYEPKLARFLHRKSWHFNADVRRQQAPKRASR
jgi:hypothetical protein